MNGGPKIGPMLISATENPRPVASDRQWVLVGGRPLKYCVVLVVHEAGFCKPPANGPTD